MWYVYSCDSDSGIVEREAYWDKEEAMEGCKSCEGIEDYIWSEVQDEWGNVLLHVKGGFNE